MRLAELADWCGGELVGADGPARGAGIDSRTLPAGALFVALRGARRDGHDFAADCADRAAGCLVARRLELDAPQIVVDDPETALQAIAARWRTRLRARVAAVTGSNGKTTTKEMTRAVLAAAGRCAASPGNWNNHLGVPLALLGIAADDDYAVLELGANRPGEIARLAAWARPDAAAVTGAAEAHLEGFGDLDGVAAAKAEIYAGLGAAGVAAVNADDRYADFWRGRAAPRRVIDFGAAAAAAVRARLGDGELELACAGETARIGWPLAGRAQRVQRRLRGGARAGARRRLPRRGRGPGGLRAAGRGPPALRARSRRRAPDRRQLQRQPRLVPGHRRARRAGARDLAGDGRDARTGGGERRLPRGRGALRARRRGGAAAGARAPGRALRPPPSARAARSAPASSRPPPCCGGNCAPAARC